MTAIHINDKKYFYPSCWEEVTVEQYIKILDWEPEKDIADRDYVKLLSILLGDKFSGMQNSIENEITLIDAVGWVVFSQFAFSKTLPKVLVFTWNLVEPRTVDIPTNIKELSIGQNIHVRRELEKCRVLEQAIPIATAIYLQPLIDKKKFDISRAKEIAKEIEQMPIYLIHPLGFFLLTRVLKPGKPSLQTWHQVNFSLNKMLKRLSPRWLGFNA